MKAEITISNLYYNNGLMSFFFRTQSKNTFEELIDKVSEDKKTVFDAIEAYSALEAYSDDLDEIEEMFYNDSIDELCETFGLTLEEEEDEEED